MRRAAQSWKILSCARVRALKDALPSRVESSIKLFARRISCHLSDYQLCDDAMKPKRPSSFQRLRRAPVSGHHRRLALDSRTDP
jgi:hypothetical protein